VWLPHDKFVELYRLAHPEIPVRSPAPEAGGIVEALYVADAPKAVSESDGIVPVAARLAIRSYVDGQWTVALPLRGVALTEATLNGQPAAVRVGESGLQLVVPKAGLHVLDLKFSVPAKLSGTAGSFALSLLPTPAAKLSFTLPQPKDSVRVNGSTSAYRRITQGERTFIEMPVDKGGDLQISWQPETSRDGGAAVIHVDSVTVVSIADAGVAVSSGFRYRVRQGIVRDVSFALPEAVKLQGVSGPDVGGWEVVGDGGQRQLRVFFRRNVGDTTQLTIDGYLAHRVTSETSTFAVPDVAPQQITAEVGHLAVYAGEQFALRAEQVQQLSQLNVENFKPEIPVTRPDAAPQLLYRFSRRPWSVTLRTSRLATQITATIQQGFMVSHRKAQTTNRVVCDLSRVPQSTIDLNVPADWVILDVQSGALKDWYLTKLDNGATVTIEFDQPRQGPVEIVLLATESRDPANTAVSLRTLSVRDAQKHQRQAAVWFDAGFSGQVVSLGGWKSLDAGAAASELQQLRATPIQLAFQSTADDPGAIGLTVMQAAAKLSAHSLTSISVTDVALIYGFVWQWQIDAASVDTLAVETPDWLAGRMDFTGGNLREVTSAASNPGRIRWTIALRGPVTGRFTVAATATLPPAADRVNAPAVKFFAPIDTKPLELQRHYVLLMNTSLAQLSAVDPSLTEAVQREDVPIVVRQELVDAATEFVRVKSADTAPSWTMQRYVAATSAPAAVNLADLLTVLARDGSYRTAATFTIKNRGRQFLAVQLPEKAVLLSVTVQGAASRAVKTTVDGTPTFLIALPKTSAADLSFPVQLTFSGRLPKGLPGRREITRQEIELPAPKVVEDHAEFGIHVVRTRWTVYLPEDLDAAPLDDPKRHNLNARKDAASDDTVVRALLQDYTELLSVLDAPRSAAQRSRAMNNLKQLGAAINRYSDQLQSDRKLAEENVKLQTQFESKLSLEGRQSQAVQDRGIDADVDGLQLGKGVEFQTSDAQQQLRNAIIGNSAIIVDNAGSGIQVERQLDQTFNFALQNPVPEKSAGAKAAEDAAKQVQAKGNNLDARQQYQAFNEATLEELNRDLAEKKARFYQAPQQQMGQAQGQAGVQVFNRSGSGTMPQLSAGGATAAGRPMVTGPGGGVMPELGFRTDTGLEGVPGGQMGGGGGFGGGGAVHSLFITNGAAAWFDQNAPGRDADDVIGLVVNGEALAQNEFGGVALAQAGQAGGRGAAAGLSLPIQLPQSGQVLVFTKALGDPKLALAIRPHQTVNWLLGGAWALGWIIAVIALLAALRTSRGQAWAARRLPLVLAVVAVIGALFLTGPLHVAAAMVFVIAAIATAWQNRKCVSC